MSDKIRILLNGSNRCSQVTSCNKNQFPQVAMSGIHNKRRLHPRIANEVKHVVKSLLCTSAGVPFQILLKVNTKSFLHSIKQHITGKYGGMKANAPCFPNFGIRRMSRVRFTPPPPPSHLLPEKKPALSLDWGSGWGSQLVRILYYRQKCMSQPGTEPRQSGVCPLICLYSDIRFDFEVIIL